MEAHVKEAIRCVLVHVKTDMSYGDSGTFATADGDFDWAEADKAKEGIEALEKIINTDD